MDMLLHALMNSGILEAICIYSYTLVVFLINNFQRPNTHNGLKIKGAYDYLSIFKGIKNTVLRHGFILSIWLEWFLGEGIGRFA